MQAWVVWSWAVGSHHNPVDLTPLCQPEQPGVTTQLINAPRSSRRPWQTAARDSEGLGPFTKDRQVGVVGEQAVAPTTGDFPGDVQFHQALQSFCCRGEAQPSPNGELANPDQGALPQRRENLPHAVARSPQPRELALVSLEQRQRPVGRVHGGGSGAFEAFQEERDPRLPVTIAAHRTASRSS